MGLVASRCSKSTAGAAPVVPELEIALGDNNGAVEEVLVTVAIDLLSFAERVPIGVGEGVEGGGMITFG